MSSLEDKIRALCTVVVAESEGPAFEQAIAELRSALREHHAQTRSLLKMYPPNPPPAFTKRELTTPEDARSDQPVKTEPAE